MNKGEVMYYYKIKNKLLVSHYECNNLEKIKEDEIKNSEDNIYYLLKLDPFKSKRSFSLSHGSLAFIKKEDVDILDTKAEDTVELPNWLHEKIKARKVMAINIEYPGWEKVLNRDYKKKWKINVVGLGDVGGTLIVGLRLLGGDCISEIGIYGRNSNKIKRWEYEANQILSPDITTCHPEIKIITKDKLFDCDMFVFCASVGVPKVGADIKDVRMVQYQGNSMIIKEYALMARRIGFKGIFAVVSDPVDMLCKSVLIQSNTDENGNYDFKGLAPEQIRGYGLGVMNARAAYYSKYYDESKNYQIEGRAYGPHGKGLVIANSIENYDDKISKVLTKKAIDANIKVRQTGYKPYIAPALSSGSLSIIATIKGHWHYSATYLGGVYLGARNRENDSGIELERLDLPSELMDRIRQTYKGLNKTI